MLYETWKHGLAHGNQVMLLTMLTHPEHAVGAVHMLVSAQGLTAGSCLSSYLSQDTRAGASHVQVFKIKLFQVLLEQVLLGRTQELPVHMIRRGAGDGMGRTGCTWA